MRLGLGRWFSTAACLLLTAMVAACSPFAALTTEPELQPLPNVEGLPVAVDTAGSFLIKACDTVSDDGPLLLDLYETTSADAIAMVADGTVELAIVLVPSGTDLELPEGLGSAVIAHDGLVLISHPDSALKDIDSDTLRDLYQGYVLDWADLDMGQGEPKVLIQMDDSRVSLWQQAMLEGESSSSGCIVMPDDRAVVDYVRGNIGAVGYCSASVARAIGGVRIVTIDGVTYDADEADAWPMLLDVVLVAPDDIAGSGRDLADWLLSEQATLIIESCFPIS